MLTHCLSINLHVSDIILCMCQLQSCVDINAATVTEISQ